MRVAPAIELSSEARLELEKLSRRRTTSVRVVQRSRIVLLAAEGMQNKQIAERLGVAPRMAALWRSRFIELGVAGLMKDAPRPGRTPAISPLRIAGVIARTTQSRPAGATHWSRSRMARETGISESSVGRIWRAHGLKPHRIDSFKVSNDPHFAEKLDAIVGLYLNPPGTRAGAECGREEPDTGPGPHAARPAYEEGPRRNHDARLQAQRHDDLVRCAEYRQWRDLSGCARKSTVIRNG